MSYVPVFETVKSPSTFVSEEALVLLVLCNTCTFFDVPPPPYVPVTLQRLVEPLLITQAVRNKLSMLGKAGKIIIVDSRDHADAYENVTVKPNEIEASRAFGDGSVMDMDALSVLAASISQKNERTTLVTLGEKGCFVAQDGQVLHSPACAVEPPIDFCGAGDTFLAGYGTLLAGGATPLQAAQIACLCSAVTIKKLGETGTASRDEILMAWDAYCR